MTPSPAVALLGPQHVRANVDGVLNELGVGTLGNDDGDGNRASGGEVSVALCTAGWQERESDDTALVGVIGKLGVSSVNLRLHARSENVFAEDPELAAAYAQRQELLRHLQDFYRVRLDHEDEAARAISVRQVEPELLEQESQISLEGFRRIDRDHLERCRNIHAAFDERWRISERPSVARHREELRAIISASSALLIAGGHVASLLNRLKLFDVLGLASGRHVIGWSAGAMVLTERIVLFHDFPPYGKDIAQVLDAGFGLAPGVVVLPDPLRRIRSDDRAGIARFAQRMAPMTCVALDHGAEALFSAGNLARASVDRLTTDGDYQRKWAG